MKKLALAGALSCALAVSACQSTGGASIDLSAAIQTGCGIAVPASDIAAVIAAGNGAVMTAGQVVEAVCGALNPKSAVRLASARRLPSSGVVSVNGVRVHYTRVSR